MPEEKIVIDFGPMLNRQLRKVMQEAVESLDVRDLLDLQEMIHTELAKRLKELHSDG